MSGPPDLLTEGRLIERFGWTFAELDEQDSGRTLQTAALLNISTLYPAVLDAVARHAVGGLTEAHWNAFKIMNSLGDDE